MIFNPRPAFNVSLQTTGYADSLWLIPGLMVKLPDNIIGRWKMPTQPKSIKHHNHPSTSLWFSPHVGLINSLTFEVDSPIFGGFDINYRNITSITQLLDFTINAVFALIIEFSTYLVKTLSKFSFGLQKSSKISYLC